MRRITAFFLLGLCLLSPGLFSQEAASTIPEELRKPAQGEAPRYPQDMVIGELGQGKAPESAYRFAGEFLDALTAGSKEAPILADSAPELIERISGEIMDIEPRTYHLGGGKLEADGSVSFLVRILGAEESITGELYLRREESGAPAEIPESAGGESGETAAGAAAENADSPAAETAEPLLPGAEESGTSPSPPAASVRWLPDDLVLEEKRALTDIEDSYRFDFSPYERFY